MTKEIAQAHDHLFKLLLEQPGIPRALLRERLPSVLVARMADADPEPVPGELVGGRLREVRTDRLFRQQLLDGSSFSCVIEHKSAPAPRVGFQFLRYLDEAWQLLLEQAPSHERPPLVFPLVVYNGRPEWSLPRRFADGLAVDGTLRGLALDFPIEVFDLGVGDELLLSVHPGLRGGLRLLRHGVVPPPPEQIEPLLLSILADLQGMPDRFLQAAGHYILDRWAPLSREEFLVAVRAVMPGKEEQMRSKAAEEFVAEGFEKGREEGREEGIETGEAKLLLLLLEHKFGPVSEGLRPRICSASTELLNLWSVRVLDAQRIEEVFEDAAH